MRIRFGFLILLLACSCHRHDETGIPSVSIPGEFVGKGIHLGMSETDLKKGRSLMEGEDGYAEQLSGNRYFGTASYWCRSGVLYCVTLLGESQTSLVPISLLDTLTNICRSSYGNSYSVKKVNFLKDTTTYRIWPIGKGKYAMLGYGATDDEIARDRPDSLAIFLVIGSDSTGWRSVNSAEELVK